MIGQLGGGVGQWESAQIKFNPTGNVQVLTGSHSHGQGHETTFAQIVSDKLGVPIENIEVVHGDTATTPFGMGTYGSRSLAVGGSAIMKAADKIIAKGKKIAAHLMEADVADVVFEHGTFKVAGTDKAVPLGAAVFAAYVPHNYPLEELEPGMDENAFYDPSNFVYPVRHADLRGRDRPRHRRGRDRQPHRGRRLRQHHQSDDRRGPGAWRHRPGRRPGAARERRLRQGDRAAR